MNNHRTIFTPQYKQSSGPGSTLEASKPYRDFVSSFIADKHIKSVLDLGCGDGLVGANIELHDATYLGVDVIGDRIEQNIACYGDENRFYDQRDIRLTQPDADLVLCKDVLQHWNNLEVSSYLAYLRATRHMYRYAILTNDHYEGGDRDINVDVATGSWRPLNLMGPPFCLDGELVYSYTCRRGEHIDRKVLVMITGSRGAA